MQDTDVVLMTVALTPFDPKTMKPSGESVTVVQQPLYLKYADTAIRVGLQTIGSDLRADINAELAAASNADARVTPVDNALTNAQTVLASMRG